MDTSPRPSSTFLPDHVRVQVMNVAERGVLGLDVGPGEDGAFSGVFALVGRQGAL